MKRAIFFLMAVMAFANILVPAGGWAKENKADGKKPAAFDPAGAADAPELRLLRITPQGEDMAPGRQIVFQFDRPVVPVGRMERSADELPIAISPELRCQWRWINTDALACQLDEKNALKPATRYTVRVAPGLRGEGGAVMKKAVVGGFVTERPGVRHVRFGRWLAPGWPSIQVTFNQPVTRSSVAAHLRFLPAGDDRDQYGLEATPVEEDRSPVWVAPFPGEPFELVDPQYRSTAVDDRKTVHRGEEARRVWMVAPERELPLDTGVRLSVKPGLVSPLGPEPGAESRVLTEFHTFPKFRFLGISCTRADTGKSWLLTPFEGDGQDARENPPRCLPLQGVYLAFSAPVPQAEIRAHLTFAPDLAGGRSDYDPWANIHDYDRLRQPHRKERTYKVRLPESLKAFERYRITGDTAGIRDAFGRSPDRPVEMTFFTAHRRPRLVLDHSKAVLEKQVDTDVPVYVTNLEVLKAPHRTVTTAGTVDRNDFQKALPKVEDISFAVPLGVREMLGGRSGAVTGFLDSRPRPENHDPNRYRFFAQVTPFQVHVKLGHFSSIAWVTDLADGKPVAGARVTVYADNYGLGRAVAAGADEASDPPDPQATRARAVTDARGIVKLPGIDALDPDLRLVRFNWKDERPRLFLRVDKDDDMALVPLDHYFMTWAGRVGSYIRPRDGHLQAWGFTAQGVYKVGDTVDYKLYVRNQSNRHWVAPPKGPYFLEVIDPKGEAVEKIEALTLSEFGAYSGRFPLSDRAAVGWYRFRLRYGDEKQGLLDVMRVLVSDFAPSPFRVSTEADGDAFGPGDAIHIVTTARMHAGGPFAGAETRTTVRLRRERFRSRHAEGFTFEAGGGHRGEVLVNRSTLTGDNNGEAAVAVTLDDSKFDYGSIEIEGAVRDDRGKYVAARTNARYYGRDRYVGLRNTAWTYEAGRPASIQYMVVDRTGEPAPGTKVAIGIERQEMRASRVQGAGNAYLTRYVEAWVAAGACSGVSAGKARTCTFTPEKPGRYRITARISDTQDRVHEARIDAWVTGKGQVVWQEPDDYSLPISAEKESYRVGDTARFLVKNPFPGAQALITVERYGVMRHWVQELKDAAEVIEVPVQPDDLPGFYLSVLVNSPRVAQPLGAGNVDLGKPTFRLGYIKVPVRNGAKQIDLRIETEQKVYKPRQRVRASIQAILPPGSQKPPLEIAVVAIDEAVFDLNAAGRGYYDPIQGFNRLDPLDLNNYSLLTRLVGRQKFETKGANPGGGGGQGAGASLRNLFRFISYWNPSIRPDEKGRAQIEFDLPDNLTGWRIFALAVTPEDLMGLGETTVTVNRPTELRPVMPNQVTGGDAFLAGFSVMNRTGQARTLTVDLKAAGALAPDSEKGRTVTASLAPYARQTVWLSVTTRGAGEVAFSARAADALDADAVEHHLPVRPYRNLVTAADYGSFTADQIRVAVAVPRAAMPDAGEIRVTASPTAIGNIEGAFGYIRDYPYACWEQLLTRAVMADRYNRLRDYLPGDLDWPESKTLPRDVLERAASFQAPGGGMAYWIADERYVSPYLSAYTALAFNWLRQSGHSVPQAVADKLEAYLLTLLRRDVMPTFFTQGMASSVRAVALAALAESGKLGRDELLRHEVHLAQMDLFGKAHFLRAAVRVAGGRPGAQKALDMILGQASQSGGKFQFNEPWDDSYSYILATPLRSNCAVLGTLAELAQDDQFAEQIGDIPLRQVRAVTQARGNRNHWENTQENLFCMNALVDYARVFEKEEPQMAVSTFLGGQSLGEARFSDRRDPPAAFDAPLARAGGPGAETEVRITKEGPGRLYYAAQLRYTPAGEAARRINAGMEIRREYSVQRDGTWQLLADPMAIGRGELVRVDLYLSVPTLRHFVVVDDPVPGGLEPVSRDLATASAVDADAGEFKAADGAFWFHYGDWAEYGLYGYSFYHKALRHHAARFFADALPAGNYHLSYTAQAVAPGDFAVMPVRAEEMYDLNVFGQGMPATLTVTRP